MRRDAVTFDKMRRCSACRRVKPLSDYSRRKNADGKTGKSYEIHYTCKSCCNQRAKEWYANNQERAKATRLSWARNLRNDAINAIGDKCCRCCGERRSSMIDIDHINGGGLEHRLRRGTDAMYRDMIASPSDYQLLCCNCNQSKRRNGGKCEHVTERATIDLSLAETLGLA